MSKNIKFNLICDDQPVRTLEDLQNNFSIEDMLDYYKNQLLHRWLDVHGYAEELKKVKAIVSEKPIEIIKELVKIFDVDKDDKKVEESIYILDYLEERKRKYSIYRKENYKSKNIIKDYATGYRQLVEGILNNFDNAAKIKANIAEMTSNYAWALELNHRDLFYLLKDKSPLAIMCLLMNKRSRDYYFPSPRKGLFGHIIDNLANTLQSFGSIDSLEEDREIKEMMYSEEHESDKEEMYQQICKMIITVEFSTNLGENLIRFSGKTDGYWKDIEPKGKKYMIINMGAGDFVRPAGVCGGDLSREEIFNKFVIVDGIDYKSNSQSNWIVYMEV